VVRPQEEEPQRSFRWASRFPRASRLLLAALTAALLAGLMVQWKPQGGAGGLRVGDVAPSDIRAPENITVVDEELTRAKRRQARDAVPPVFEFDSALRESVQDRVSKAFSEMRQALPSTAPPAAPTRPGAPSPDPSPPTSADAPDFSVLADAFERALGVDLRDTDLATLQLIGFPEAAERDVKELVRLGMSDPVILVREGLPSTGRVVVVDTSDGRRAESVRQDVSGIRDLQETRRYVSSVAAEDFSDRPAHVLDTVAYVARDLIAPNLRFDAAETEKRRQAAERDVQPVTTSYQRGQVILRSGEVVDAWTVRVLQEIRARSHAYHPWMHELALAALLLGFLISIERFAEAYISKFRRRYGDLLALAGMLLLIAASMALLRAIGTAMADAVPGIPRSAYVYLAPIAAGSIMTRTLMNSETALVWTLLTASITTQIAGGDLWLFVYLVISALAGSGGVGRALERGRLVRAGFVAALANACVVIAIDLVTMAGLRAQPWGDAGGFPGLLFHLLFALAGGLVSGVLAVGLAPVFETLGFVTHSKLLELASLNHPLMRDMIVKAPGTYHHSMVVGSLAEAACESIHANSLLVRVGAYYHDIGKMLKPQYFIENQHSENLHDRLTPSMSALIIINHVKEGIELAREHRLPEPIVDLIPQHHGTSKVSFFYNKALQTADPDKGEVREQDYRYPGPKPQTREAAIMMLADGVEAATRSLTNHTPGAIRARVEKIVNQVIADGQLEQTPLTLRDLHAVSETFVQVLLGIHHHRVEYPTPPNPADLKNRGLPASSITLEIPPVTPNPDEPHPLEQAQVEPPRTGGNSR
jgi:putative nucleotidyltransferase with HDIG domain